MEVGQSARGDARWKRWRSFSSIRRLVGVTLGVASVFVLCALPANPDAAAAAAGSPPPDDAFRLLRGANLEDLCMNNNGGEVRGHLKDDAVLTMILSPKDIEGGERAGESLGDNSGNANHLRHLMYNWANTTRVNFLVMSKNCAVRKIADDFDLPMVYKSSGSDISDLTIKHILKVVRDTSTTPFVGFVNGDIMFDESLPRTVEAAIRFRTAHPDKHIAITGRRKDTDVPLVPMEKPIEADSYKSFLGRVRQNNKLRHERSQDYFIFDRESPLNIENMKPFLLGGVRFDNFLTAEFLRLDRNYGNVLAVDTTNTINAYHVNHGKEGRVSRSSKTLASAFNKQLWGSLDNFHRNYDNMNVNNFPTITIWDVLDNKGKQPRVKLVDRTTGTEKE